MIAPNLSLNFLMAFPALLQARLGKHPEFHTSTRGCLRAGCLGVCKCLLKPDPRSWDGMSDTWLTQPVLPPALPTTGALPLPHPPQQSRALGPSSQSKDAGTGNMWQLTYQSARKWWWRWM